ncbi:InlB B-repeat-containing protein, partial [Gardnerella vaginalis]|uniref:InlB B-repeat-containing protein n=1 Tax=Gardnerella vaginalis TaxID=2702 RepID=UPI0039F08D24
GTAPSRTDYVFTGWTPTVANKVTRDVTYVAQWKDDKNNNGTPDDQEDHFTVTYTDGVAGEEIFANQVHKNVLVGTSTPAFEGTVPNRTDYVFEGWAPAVANKVTRDVTYVAQWKRIQRTVTFKNGSETHATVKVENGKAIDQSMPKNPTKAGYTFNEWNTKEDGKGDKFTGASVVNGDMTVYAIYTQDTETKDPQQPPTPQPRTPAPAPKPKPEPKAPAPAPKPKPKAPDPKPQPETRVQYSFEPAILDTQEAEVLHGKMKYEADDTLPYNTQKKISDPVDGLKITTHTGSFVNGKWVPIDKVEITPAKDGLTKVGNKQVTHEGNKTIITTYDVDPDTGELTNPKKHISMPMASSIDSSANGDGSTSGSDALQPVGTRSADALPNTGSNASGITFAFFGAMVFGMLAASGAAANCKRAKHLR